MSFDRRRPQALVSEDQFGSMDTTGEGTLKVPGDSVRLENTLSTPPLSDSVR